MAQLTNRSYRLRWWTATAVVVLVAAVSAFWAGRVTMSVPAGEQVDVPAVVHTVAETTVGQSIALNVTVERPFSLVATNALRGTVTFVGADEPVQTGDVLFEVDAVPVRAVEGGTPFWRAMGSGTTGEDVAQVQRALAELGHYRGEVDGRFRWSTTQAVQAWQEALNIPETGVVEHGALVAVPELPAQVRLADEIVTGARLSGGEPAVSTTSGQVEFSLVVSTSQARLIPPDAPATVEHGEHRWEAVLRESSTDESGNVRFGLSGPDGEPVCGDDCDALPAVERTSLRSEVVVVPNVTGPAVPVAALHTDPDGEAWLRMADGARRVVTVRGSSDGVAVLDGVSVGERVRVLADDNSAPGEPGGSADGGGGSDARGR